VVQLVSGQGGDAHHEHVRDEWAVLHFQMDPGEIKLGHPAIGLGHNLVHWEWLGSGHYSVYWE